MTKKDYIADNAVVEDAVIEGVGGVGSFDLPPFLGKMWDTADDEDISPVIRVHANPTDGGVVLSGNLESDESGFEIGVSIELNAEQSRRAAEAIIGTVDGIEEIERERDSE